MYADHEAYLAIARICGMLEALNTGVNLPRPWDRKTLRRCVLRGKEEAVKLLVMLGNPSVSQDTEGGA